MLGQTAERFFTPEDHAADRIGTEMRLAVEHGRASDERWHLRKDGSRFWASGEMMPLADERGPLGFLKILRDRTPEHLAGEKLAASEERYRTLFETVETGFCIIEMRFDEADRAVDYRIAEANPAFERLTGQCGVTGQWVSEFAPTLERHWFDTYGRVALTGEPVRFENAAEAFGRWYDVQALRIGNPAARRVAILFNDISARRSVELALARSEEHWRGLFERLQEGLIIGELVRDDDGRVVDWRYLDVNPAWAALVRLEQGDAVGRTIRELFPGIEQAWIDEPAGVVESGEAAIFTRQVGRIGRWYEGRMYPLGADRFTVIFQEVTERHLAEQRRAAALELGDRLRGEGTPAALALAGCEVIGRALGVGRVGYGAVGPDGEAFTVERDWTVPGFPSLAGRYRMDDYGLYAENLRRGEAVVIPDVREDPRTSATAPALESVAARTLINLPIVERGRIAAVLYINDDQPRAWTAEEAAFAQDMAERLRQAIERRRAEQGLQALAASLEQQVVERTRERDRFWQLSRDPFLVSDRDGTWVQVSPAWTAILGWTEQELLGRTSEWMEHPEDRARTRAEVGSLADGQTTMRFENRFRARDGSYRWFSWTAVPTEEGLVYCVARDMTEEKELAASRERLEEELRQSQKMEAVGQLTGGLAHDFNNLLTGITGSLELLGTRVAQGRLKDVDRYVSAAQGAAKRAAALTHRLLAFSRRQTLDPKPTDVNRLISGMEDLVRRTVGPEIAVEVVGAGGLWTTLVDPPQLENALLNLCINARDAMPDGGRITVETANTWLDERAARERDLPPGQYVSLCVTDTGTGMPPEVIARIFDPFYTTKPLGQGTGLGLSMIYGFVRQSGGQVRVYSELAQGTTMCLYLPRHHGEEDADTGDAALADAARAEPGETVLVVDDEPTVRMLVTEVLEDLGYTAVEAGDGVSGLMVLRSDARIDLLVTDVGLPGGMNGRQLADAAREVRPELRVLFITGYAENAAIGNGHLAPGMQVLTKPFAMEPLASRIKELINASPN
ncbi:PAS domain S-box protein [Roseomonas sp. KE2513]|nr:PAS domain S-box protein [Roseomonas sp. KE2513]